MNKLLGYMLFSLLMLLLWASNAGAATTPTAPDDLEAETYSSSRINLTWDDNSGDESGFYIYRKTGSSGTYNLIASVSANTEEYRNTNLDEDTKYYYKIQAYNSSGNSGYSNEDYATTDSDSNDDLEAPDNLQAEAYSHSRIDLTWDDNSRDETRFYIYRKTGSSGSYSEIDRVDANTEEYRDSDLDSDTKYYYKIRAYDGDTYSSFSNEDSAITEDSGSSSSSDLEAPDNLNAEAYSSSRIDLTWDDNSSAATRFYIFRKTGSNGSYSEIADVRADTEEYRDTNLDSDTKYYYKIRAYDGDDYSSFSDEESATTEDHGGSSNSDLEAPDNLKAEAYSQSRIDLTWDDNSRDETKFYIYRRSGSSGSYSEIASVSSNTKEYRDTDLDEDTKYYYKIKAYDGDEYSDYSNEDYATTGDDAGSNSDLEAPDNLEVEAASSSRIDLTWDDNSRDETRFYIFRKTGSSGSYSQLASVNANSESYRDTDLKADTKYYYKIRAYDGDDYSDFSDEEYATTDTGTEEMGAPGNLTATVSSGSVRLVWIDNSSKEASFVIQRKSGSGNYEVLSWLGPNITSYNDNTAANSTVYSYRVRAYNADGYSDYSNVVTAQPSGQVNPSTQTKQLRFSTGKKVYYCKGQPLNMDAAPINLNDRVMIPIRYVTDQLGANVTYDDKTQKVTIKYNSKTIELWAGRNKASINSVSKSIDATSSKVTPVIVPPGRVMVPIRFVSESLGCQVGWEAATNTAIITLP